MPLADCHALLCNKMPVSCSESGVSGEPDGALSCIRSQAVHQNCAEQQDMTGTALGMHKLPPVTHVGRSKSCKRTACRTHLLIDEQRSGVRVRLVQLVLARRE